MFTDSWWLLLRDWWRGWAGVDGGASSIVASELPLLVEEREGERGGEWRRDAMARFL
jgi:hypothetical protein